MDIKKDSKPRSIISLSEERMKRQEKKNEHNERVKREYNLTRKSLTPPSQAQIIRDLKASIHRLETYIKQMAHDHHDKITENRRLIRKLVRLITETTRS